MRRWALASRVMDDPGGEHGRNTPLHEEGAPSRSRPGSPSACPCKGDAKASAGPSAQRRPSGAMSLRDLETGLDGANLVVDDA